MGGSHSREGELHSSDEDSESESEEEYYDEAEENQDKHCDQSPEKKNEGEMKSINGLEEKLGALKINEGLQGLKPAKGFTVKLYRHIGGNTPTAKWAVADKLVSCQITRQGDDDDQDPDSEDDDEGFLKRNKGKGKGKDFKSWELKVGDKVKSRVDEHLQLRTFDDQLRVDFVSLGVWALKFLNPEDFKKFVGIFQDCLFENTYLMEANKENKLKVYGKDFMGWADPDAADESVWEDASEGENSGNKESNHQQGNFKEEFEEEGAGGGGIQSLAMGALDYSFLVSGSGVEAVKNMRHGIHGKGLSVPFKNSKLQSSTPKKALLMRAETNMLLMSPAKAGRPHSTGLHQFDVETGKVVSEWRFEKDGAPVTMRDVTNDTKGSQLDPTESTFLGLDDNRLCRWDMRVKYGNVQQIDESPVLGWTEGHQFSRGTNFQCFASTGDGSIVVGSADGRIRLYGKTSMRMAKTAFPGLGSPITHVDVTFDGKWILGTTDTYLVLVSTLFTDKDGRVKTGFTGRMGNKIAAPRLLKLTPLDSHLAGNQNKFQGGKFSWVTESGRQEHHLVASVGNYTVIWNFKQVKNSAHDCYKNQEGLKSCYCYKIVPKNESIVDSRFMHEKYAVTDNPEAPLVVVTPKNVSSFSIGQDR